MKIAMWIYIYIYIVLQGSIAIASARVAEGRKPHCVVRRPVYRKRYDRMRGCVDHSLHAKDCNSRHVSSIARCLATQQGVGAQ